MLLQSLPFGIQKVSRSEFLISILKTKEISLANTMNKLSPPHAEFKLRNLTPHISQYFINVIYVLLGKA